GEALWTDPALFAPYSWDPGRAAQGDAEAARFIRALARALGVAAEHGMPAFEDTWYYLWRERRLPTNIDPHDSRLDDAEERARLARSFERGLGQIAGYVLPLRVEREGWCASAPDPSEPTRWS